MKRGFTLVEVVVAMLVTAVVVTSVFAVAMTVKRGTAVSERRVAANNAGKELLEKLKNYVTPETGTWPGPGVGGSWRLPEDSCGTCPAGCYALRVGCEHDASSLIPARWRAAPYNMTLRYQVYVIENPPGSCGGALPCGTGQPQIEVRLRWDEPQ